jgi:cellulose synthase operon protein C
MSGDRVVRIEPGLARIIDHASSIGSAKLQGQISDSTVGQDPFDKTLNDQINQMRDRIIAGDAPTALKLLHALLKSLPGSATAKIIFRIKANIGHCHLQLGDDAEAVRWLEEAYAAAPLEPKAVANKALAMIVSGQPAAAVEFTKVALTADPENEFAAAHLLQAAAHLSDGEDPFPLIPAGLREREEVVVSRAFYLQQREMRPEWWTYARSAGSRFPTNDRLKLLVAESALDEATFDGAFQVATGITEELRRRLTDASAFFDERWLKIERSATPDRREGVPILNAAMLVFQILGRYDESIQFAELLADRTHDEQVLLNVAQVARSSHKHDLALHALEHAGTSPRSNFLRGMIQLERNEWLEASASFASADIPPSEANVVRTVIALAPLRTGTLALDGKAFEAARSLANGDPRALVVLARVASMRGIPDVADEAFAAAKAALSAGSTISERSMVAALASDRGDSHAVIEVLDGHLPENVPSQDLVMLAEAHASEYPKRERNVRFFARLGREILKRPEIARCRATVLLDAGEIRDAERIFRSLTKERPTDAYAILRHIEALRRLGRQSEVESIVLAVEEKLLAGPPEYLMAFAQALRQAGGAERALAFAYEIVRQNSDNPKVSLGYVSLVLGDREEKIIPELTVAAQDAWVRLTKDNEADSFVIEQGAQFFGIEHIAPDVERAKRVLGMSVGQTFLADKGMFPAETWTLAEVKSKYLHLLHILMNDFETRYPGANGLWRVDIKDQELQPVLDFIRKKAEADREIAASYTEKGLPLSFVARMLGGEPAGFAQFIRSLDSDIVTCLGNEVERRAAFELAQKARGNAVVLDEYTAWVAAEIGILEILKSWFGRLLTPSSTIASIDRLINREEEGLGRRSMSIAWRDGEYYRTEATDEDIQRQVAALGRIKESIEAHCEVQRPLIPDNLPEFAIQIVEQFGSRLLDPILLAGSHEAVLLSDDLRYRQIGEIVNGTKGLWLQAVLACALDADLIDLKIATASYIQLAARRHSHVTLNANILREALDGCTADSLAEFDAITNFIGSKDADMTSHLLVTIRFLNALWASRKGDLKCQKATGIIVGKLI